ncbi:MAG TPA: hypothetical protein PKJ63_01535 [Cyclobacteriaceae bacterium]|nr:hypothetical protein [Cyclobacteriaceae bacterium]
MTKKKQNNLNQLKELLSIKPAEFVDSLNNTQLIQDQLKEFIKCYNLKREDVMRVCGWSQALYYRNLNKSSKVKITELIEIVKLARKK